MRGLIFFILVFNCFSESKVTRISKEVNIVDMETSKVLKVIGPGYYYSDEEYSKLLNDQNRRMSLMQNELKIMSLKQDLSNAMIETQAKKMAIAKDLLVSVETLQEVKLKVEQENLRYYKTLHDNQDSILQLERDKNSILIKENKSLKKANWWNKTLQYVAFGIGVKVGSL